MCCASRQRTHQHRQPGNCFHPLSLCLSLSMLPSATPFLPLLRAKTPNPAAPLTDCVQIIRGIARNPTCPPPIPLRIYAAEHVRTTCSFIAPQPSQPNRSEITYTPRTILSTWYPNLRTLLYSFESATVDSRKSQTSRRPISQR